MFVCLFVWFGLVWFGLVWFGLVWFVCLFVCLFVCVFVCVCVCFSVVVFDLVCLFSSFVFVCIFALLVLAPPPALNVRMALEMHRPDAGDTSRLIFQLGVESRGLYTCLTYPVVFFSLAIFDTFPSHSAH